MDDQENNSPLDPNQAQEQPEEAEGGEVDEVSEDNLDAGGGLPPGADGVDGELPTLSSVGNQRLARVLVVARWHVTTGTELHTSEIGHACIQAFGLDPIVVVRLDDAHRTALIEFETPDDKTEFKGQVQTGTGVVSWRGSKYIVTAIEPEASHVVQFLSAVLAEVEQTNVVWGLELGNMARAEWLYRMENTVDKHQPWKS